MSETPVILTGKASVDKPWMKFFEGIDLPEVPQSTIYGTIKECCEKYSDKIAIEYFNSKITYKQMLANIDKTADAYQAAGVKPGDFVSLCMLSTPECVYSLYALAKIGAVSNFIEPRCNPKRILRHVNDTGSRILVIIDIFLDKLSSIIDELDATTIVVVSLSESMSSLNKFAFNFSVKGHALNNTAKKFRGISWEDFIAGGAETESFTAEYTPNTVASVVYTGGTTGLPKGAMITHDTFNHLAVCTPVMCHLIPLSKTFLNIMPPFIAYGLVYGQFMPYFLGLHVQMVPNFTIGKFDKILLKYKPGCVFGVPSFFETLMHSPLFEHRSLSFITCIITGGDKLTAPTETMLNDFLKSHGYRAVIYKGYGMTELGSAATFTFSRGANVPGSVGIPIYHNNVMIIDEETGAELDYNCPGEICISGPTMTKGYVGNEAETRNLLHRHPDGTTWIHTGDIGYITEQGVIFIIDRKKRIIIRPDGHNVWPSLIEETLVQHPAVAACCTIGLPPKKSETGRIPTAFVVLKEGYEPSDALIDELDVFSSMHLAERDMALAYRFIDSLPITGIGKVDYRALERKYSGEE